MIGLYVGVAGLVLSLLIFGYALIVSRRIKCVYLAGRTLIEFTAALCHAKIDEARDRSDTDWAVIDKANDKRWQMYREFDSEPLVWLPWLSISKAADRTRAAIEAVK